MTPAELEAIRERERKATPAPWVDMSTAEEVRPIVAADTFTEICLSPECDDREADRAFIAHARADIPALLGEVERLRKALEAAVVRRPLITADQIMEHNARIDRDSEGS